MGVSKAIIKKTDGPTYKERRLSLAVEGYAS